jgi:hypothetical protein
MLNGKTMLNKFRCIIMDRTKLNKINKYLQYLNF